MRQLSVQHPSSGKIKIKKVISTMTTTRRNFIKTSALASAVALFELPKITQAKNKKSVFPETKKPVVISTWNHGLAANEGAWKVLSGNGTALDAVEKGVRVTEDDFTNLSVGLGGMPD